MSKQRSQKPKQDGSLIPEESVFVTPKAEGETPVDLPFEEFSDHDINNEKWDNTPTTKEKSMLSTQSSFEDPHKIHLPPGIVCHEWKRCSEVFPEVNFVVFASMNEYPDLVTPNPHLLPNEFYRSYISNIENLLYIGTTRPFPTEYGTNVFFTSGAKQWRPWHHIYSNCKVDKGEHNPSYNPAGKYVVRLFWLGAWRKVYVDDYLPIDKSGNILLPTLELPMSTPISDLNETVGKANKATGKTKKSSPAKKDVIQLWPMLLCKGLLKIANLSLKGLRDGYVDFDMLNCLTGWVSQIVQRGIAGDDLWDIFMAYVQRFEWSETKDGSTKSKSKNKEQKGGSKKLPKQSIPIGIENMQDGDRHVVLTCNDDLQRNNSTVRPQSTVILLSEVRDVPLVQPPPRPELEFWKTFRYEKWAEEHGIIPRDIKKMNIRSLKIVNPFKRINETTSENDPGAENADQGVDHSDKKSVKSSKSSKKTGKSTKFAQLQPDPAMWIDFDQLKDVIDHVTIYFQPRCFKDKTMVSNLQFPNKTSDFRYTISTQDGSVREPIYLFMDSVDYKFIIFNLCQMGNTSALDKPIKEEIPELEQKSSEDLDICDTIVLWKTRKELSAKSSEEIYRKPSILDSQNKSISLVLEQYRWDSNELGPCTATLNTLGNKSFMLDLKPGRATFRLWVSSQCSYVLQIFSDTSAVVCCLEEYLTTCATESQLLKNLCYEISSCYGKLVQSFGRPEFLLCLRNFYQCYKPYQNLTKQENLLLHKTFFEEFCHIVSENATPPNAVYAINLLFLQLKTFDYVNSYLEEPHLYPSKFKLNDQVEYAKVMQRAAVKIQAYFKSIYIRLMLKKAEESHKEYYGLFNTMKSVYSDIFSSSKRLNYCPIMLRRLFEREDIIPLLPKIDLYQDIHSVLYNQVFSGIHTGPFPPWLPIFRFEFFVNSITPVKVKIKAFSTLKQISVRVFDNDSLLEVKSLLGSPVVADYVNNKKGYTILCYGWTDDAQKVSWKLIVSVKATSKNDLITVPVPAVTTLSFKDYYIPNFNHIICRYSFRLSADSALTVNLTSSLEGVVICLTFYDQNGKKIKETYGTRNAIFPIVYLKTDPNAAFPVVKKRINSLLSGTSEITYSKLGTYGFATESASYRSSTSKKESISTEKDSEIDKNYIRSNSTIPSEENGPPQNTGSGLDAKSQSKKAKASRSSTSSKNKNISKSLTSSNGGESCRTEFVLEAKVVDETWPLTADEWARVQKLREKSYLNLLEESRKPSIKRQSLPKKSTTLPLDEPFWVLDVLYSSESPIEFEQDRSKNEIIKSIKAKWFTDIERYKRAIELRETYISQHSVAKSNFSIDPIKKSNNVKDFWPKLIGEESLIDYMIKPPEEVDETSCITKGTDDYIIEDANLERKIKQHREDKHATLDELESQLQEQKENSDIIDDWFEGVRRDSSEMINDALEMKQQYVQKLLSSSKTKGEKKSKVDKKKK